MSDADQKWFFDPTTKEVSQGKPLAGKIGWARMTPAKRQKTPSKSPKPAMMRQMPQTKKMTGIN